MTWSLDTSTSSPRIGSRKYLTKGKWRMWRRDQHNIAIVISNMCYMTNLSIMYYHVDIFIIMVPTYTLQLKYECE